MTEIHLKFYDHNLDCKSFILPKSLLDDGSELSCISHKTAKHYIFPITKVADLYKRMRLIKR